MTREQNAYPKDQKGQIPYFWSKWQEKPIPFGTAHTYIAHIMEYPPPPWGFMAERSGGLTRSHGKKFTLIVYFMKFGQSWHFIIQSTKITKLWYLMCQKSNVCPLIKYSFILSNSLAKLCVIIYSQRSSRNAVWSLIEGNNICIQLFHKGRPT